jgi:hypothetical protein
MKDIIVNYKCYLAFLCLAYLLQPSYVYAHGANVIFYNYLPVWLGLALAPGILKTIIIKKVSTRIYSKNIRLGASIIIIDVVTHLFSVFASLLILSAFVPYKKNKEVQDPVQWGMYAFIILFINIFLLKNKEEKFGEFLLSARKWIWLILLTSIYPIVVFCFLKIVRS